MGYIEELRQRIGSYPVILAGAGILITNTKKQLLLVKRSDNGYWAIPGGAMEPGEYTIDTAIRETFEETGLKINQAELFNVYSGPDLFYEYPNGDQVYNVSIVYKAQLNGETPRITLNEHTEYGFFDLAHIPSKISPPVIPIIDEFVQVQKQRTDEN